MKNINFLDHPYWIPKCLNVGQISIPLQIFSYIYFPQIFTEIGWMFENVKIPIDHHAIFLFCPFQNLLILSHLSESVDVPAGCLSFTASVGLSLPACNGLSNSDGEFEREGLKRNWYVVRRSFSRMPTARWTIGVCGEWVPSEQF